MAYLVWLFYMQWGHTSLLLFDRSKLTQQQKVRTIKWMIKWVYMIAYQVKLIEEASWCIFWRTFSLFSHSYRKVVTDRMNDQMSLSDGLSSQTHWRRFVTHLLQNLSTVSSFISKGGNRSNAWSNEFIWWLTKSNSLKKVRDASFAESFHCFHIHIKMW